MKETGRIPLAPFACDMSGMTPTERQEHIGAIHDLFGSVLEIREINDGYAFRLPNDDATIVKDAGFVTKERLCCPFFGFALELEPEQGSLWLSLTGREAVKPFIKAEIGGALGDDVARAGGFR